MKIKDKPGFSLAINQRTGEYGYVNFNVMFATTPPQFEFFPANSSGNREYLKEADFSVVSKPNKANKIKWKQAAKRIS